ncbi:DAK2 domain-containing protein [Tessaracoccus coleopterorum]|uniref:DAK2 domain-containing protein n=1 Tax=Tessaracoccus coleopterorum TaxID=2714950 RepID=UPI002F915A15
MIAWLRECGRQFDARADELNELDRALGDGDHGTNMRRGFEAAESLNLEEHAHAADALRQVGMALVSNVGGASGPSSAPSCCVPEPTGPRRSAPSVWRARSARA